MLTAAQVTTLLDFPAIPLRTPVPETVLAALTLAVPGWPVRADPDGIRIAERHDGLQVIGDGVDEIADDGWEAAHWALAAAIGSAAEAMAGGVVLNAGAAFAGNKVVVFAGESHAGKSAIALHLATRRIPMLGDDRLILDTAATPPQATGVGLARKVRTPLPVDFAPAALQLAAETRAGHAAGADVLGWDPTVDRPAGTAAPIDRILVVRRDPSLTTTRVVALGAAEAVATLLPLCGRHHGSAAALLAAVTRLVGAVPVARLEAPNAAAAADSVVAEHLAPGIPAP